MNIIKNIKYFSKNFLYFLEYLCVFAIFCLFDTLTLGFRNIVENLYWSLSWILLRVYYPDKNSFAFDIGFLTGMNVFFCLYLELLKRI